MSVHAQDSRRTLDRPGRAGARSNRRLVLAVAAVVLLGGGLSLRTAAQAMAAGRLPL